MDLILRCHADAEPGEPDLARKLTSKGHKQAASVAIRAVITPEFV